jgi:hypothetical protein
MINLTPYEKHLTKLLPRGYGQRIANKLGVSRNTVYNTKIGKHINPRVAEELKALAEKQQQEAKEFIRSMKQLSKKAA